MSETLRGEFRMMDSDLVEILHAPEIPVHTDGAEVEVRNTQCLAAGFPIAVVKSPEIQIRRSVH